jgi:tetratricopeptide (TPR) repeat protein/tRNA A-37 threonylcarbamoyl transferase component Bud32
MFGGTAAPLEVSRYLLLRPVASGGFGAVYEAYDPELDRKVAVKLLHAPSVATPDLEDAVNRLLREARALAQLTHPAVLPVYDVGRFAPPGASSASAVFMVTELVRGATLGAWLAERRRPWPEIVRVFVTAGRGLAAAHEAGLVHRDFKPANVLIGADGRPRGAHANVRVADFGLVRWTTKADYDTAAHAVSDEPVDPDLTETGAVMGTPRYMAPEQHAGGTIDQRSDQYAFCVALFEAIHGEPPFADTTVDALARAKAVGPPPRPPAASRAPARMHRLVLRGLAPDPAARFASMAELLEQLEAIPRRRRLRIAGLAVGVAVAGAAWLASGNDERLCSEGPTLDATWNPEIGGALRERLAERSDPTIAGAVVAALDEYATQWVEQRRETCRTALGRDPSAIEATRRRLACFESRRRALEAVVGMLRDADERIARRGVTVVTTLPGLPGCSDDEALALDFLPVEPAAADAVARAMARLTSARAHRLTGHYEEARTEAVAALQAAEASGHDPTRARALFALAWTETALLELDEAERHVRAGWYLAETHGLGEMALRGVIDLSDSLRVQERFDEAWHMVELAEAKARFFPAKAGPEGDLAFQRASILAGRGRGKEAIAFFEDALRFREERFGAEHVAMAGTRLYYGQALADLGRLDAAREQLEASARIYDAQLDADPLVVAAARAELARLDDLAGRHAGAATSLGDLCGLLVAGGAPYRLDLMRCRLHAGHAHLAQHDARRAARELEQAHAIALDVLGPRAPSTVRAAEALARVVAAP